MTEADRDALIASAGRLGTTPLDLATVVSYETGGTFNPAIRGGTGNRHIGLIQFGPAEQRQYGASQSQSFSEQLPAVEAYLTDRGYRPGMGILDLYSTINAGRPGRYNASDAKNGGAPGTVADKVNDQMGDHRKKAAAFLGGEFNARMPGENLQGVSRSPFGLSGPVASEVAPPSIPSEAPPAPTDDRGVDVASLLKSLLSDGHATAAPAAPAAELSAPELLAPPTRKQAPVFDAAAFLAALRRR